MTFRYEMTSPGVQNIARIDVEVPPPAPGEVQVRLGGSSLNFHDYVTLSGLIPWVEYPRVPLSDGAGEVVAVGAGVSHFAPGDKVVTLFYPRWQEGRPNTDGKSLILGETTDGCAQELLNISANSVAQAPAHLNDLAAATLVCAGHTAWYALMEESHLQADHTVLIQGSGGVSLFALQFAKAIGAQVVATSSSDEKLQRLRELGADHVINYTTTPDWEQAVMSATGGVDVVIDVGGEATLGKSIACTNIDGFIAVIGVLSGFGDASVSIFEVMQKNLTVKGITVGCGESLQRMCRFVEQHNIEPVISHDFPVAEIAQATALMEAGGHFGKIALRIE